jgi:hypothetical protein
VCTYFTKNVCIDLLYEGHHIRMRIKMKRFFFAAILMLISNQVVLAEQLIAHVCWMGNECIKEYLISSVRHNSNAKVRIRDMGINDGGTTEGNPENLTISCKTPPPSDHYHAIEYTRWMFVCKGQKTEWSPK